MKKKSNIIFLDIDGVINPLCNYNCTYNVFGESFPSVFWIEFKNFVFLKRIIKDTNAKVVISSSWRADKPYLEIILELFYNNRIDVIGTTPCFGKKNERYKEIKQWLEDNKSNYNIEKFLIIDDQKDAGIGFEDNFYQTDGSTGITEECSVKIIDYFKKEKDND